MPTEFNPNDFRRQTFGNGSPQSPSAPAHAPVNPPAHPPVPTPQQAAPMPTQPYAPAQPMAQPHVQPHAQPFTPPLTAPALGTPHAPVMPQQQAQPYANPYPPQHQQQVPQPHIPQAPGAQAAQPYGQAPQPAPQQAQNIAPQAKSGKRKRLKMPKTGSSSGFLKPFLMGLLCGSVVTVLGVSVLGSMAKKSMDNRFASVAAQIENNPEMAPETIVIVEPEKELSPGQ